MFNLSSTVYWHIVKPKPNVCESSNYVHQLVSVRR